MTFEETIQPILGTPCQKVWRGYSTALFFEFGEKVEKKKYKYDPEWEYSIGLDMCPWQILQKEKLLFQDEDDYALIDNNIQQFLGKKLLGISILQEKKQTIFTFSDDLMLVTHHEKLDEQWYLITSSTIVSIEQNCSVLFEDRE